MLLHLKLRYNLIHTPSLQLENGVEAGAQTGERQNSTNHCILGVGLFMVHLHELLRAGAVDLTQHTEPTTEWGQRKFTKLKSAKKCHWKLHHELSQAATRGNFVPTYQLYRSTFGKENSHLW